ncbi:mechanosensitive ion channel family protein [Kaistella jeonii]|uniref:Mechanosensitive ion channel protein MscS n=1 Tax=Kaistella jeonii TaxID=266749 RepID=A0A0C1CXH7_9FLAO|nr:mechanosensitive ion channel domain-containing protein [Kaistella jeonii]KIA89071.1 mechanosensitive ion channel protein MscS [Kaistella jeonii]SFB95062.1 miniconductance mechanosensitive channel [Kaistella jeonii]VEI97125.1 Miniconductance mechanosensitive channel [Kaistella jeonii]
MNNELKDTKDFLQTISDYIHFFVRDNIPDNWVLLLQILLKFAFFVGIIYLIDFLFKLLINTIFKLFYSKDKYPVLKSIYQSRITNSFSHLMALLFGSYALFSIFYRHPKSFIFLERMIYLAIVFIVAGMLYRGLSAFRNYFIIKQDYYKIIALNAVSQTVKIFGIFVAGVIAICVIFGISGSAIVGSLGAITAVMVLVFRDTILGFVTGIHVATSKNLKVGDWIGIPKYNLEGTIEDLNLLTTKIQNFDKTISTIPTYDLLTTEIKNLQVMSESNTRRIKRSIIFNINSFKFLNLEEVNRLSKINLIKDYLDKKKEEIIKERESIENSELLINGRQLTNIGVFREYVFNYLKNSEHIDQKETLMVRQLENTPQGMPLEIYCFTNDSEWGKFEVILADIFDHLLVASKEFDLEIMQFNKM